MASSSVVLLENTANAVTVTGDALRANDGFSFTGHTYTAAIHTSNLTGVVHIEAALTNDPVAGDWFQAVPPVRFPRSPNADPVDAIVITFSGNYAFLRARLSRDGIGITDQPETSPFGFVDRILLNR